MSKNSVKSKLKANDNVVVISGADKGRKGKILFVDPQRGRVVVEGINKKKKHMRGNQENPKGGILSIEFPMQISNVQYFCEKCKKGVKLGIQLGDKAKQRVCRSCGKVIDK